MSTFLVAAFALAATLTIALQPARAGYIAPDAPWTIKAFCVNSC